MNLIEVEGRTNLAVFFEHCLNAADNLFPVTSGGSSNCATAGLSTKVKTTGTAGHSSGRERNTYSSAAGPTAMITPQ